MIRRVVESIADAWLYITLGVVTIYLIALFGLFIYSKSIVESSTEIFR